MNERIEELRIQALRWSGENVNRTLYSDYEIQLKEYKKFAELIIQECAGVCENSNYEFGTIFTKMIKQHFGVEE